MHYLAPEDILVIHALVMDQTGGLHGVRDVRLLASAAHRPMATFGGTLMYKSPFEQAAALLESLALNHVFADGNKRTSVVCAARFLEMNGYRLSATNKQLERLVFLVVTKRPSIKEVAGWLKKKSEKM